MHAHNTSAGRTRGGVAYFCARACAAFSSSPSRRSSLTTAASASGLTPFWYQRHPTAGKCACARDEAAARQRSGWSLRRKACRCAERQARTRRTSQRPMMMDTVSRSRPVLRILLISNATGRSACASGVASVGRREHEPGGAAQVESEACQLGAPCLRGTPASILRRFERDSTRARARALPSGGRRGRCRRCKRREGGGGRGRSARHFFLAPSCAQGTLMQRARALSARTVERLARLPVRDAVHGAPPLLPPTSAPPTRRETPSRRGRAWRGGAGRNLRSDGAARGRGAGARDGRGDG